jgi:transposase
VCGLPRLEERQCSLLGRAPRSGRGVGGEHPEQHLAGYAGLMQADAYAGFTKLYEPNRKPGVIIEVACWAHARRKFFDLARLSRAPIAVEAVKHIDALFAIERDINGAIPQERVRVRQARSRPLIIEPHTWLREQRAKLSKNSDTPKRSITSSLSHAAWSSAVGSNWA